MGSAMTSSNSLSSADSISVATLARIEPHASPNLESDVKALTNSAGVAVPWNTRARYFCKSGSCFN